MTDEEQRLRAPDVNYFPPSKGPFYCGHCIYFQVSQHFCEHPLIRASVDYDGCCNQYLPQ